jgi:hypothetical protein
MVNQANFSNLGKNGCFSLDTFSASRESSGKSLRRLLKLGATLRLRLQIHYAFRLTLELRANGRYNQDSREGLGTLRSDGLIQRLLAVSQCSAGLA